MRSPEGHEKQAIKKYLDSIGAWHFSPYMAGYGKNGVPDIICCIDGRFYGLEVKREGKNLTVLQCRLLEEIKEAGGIALWGTADKIIEGLKECLLCRTLVMPIEKSTTENTEKNTGISLKLI